MYYPSGVRYTADMGITEVTKTPENDVLDLCTRKENKECNGDVNGNTGYADNSNGFYGGYHREDKRGFGCKSPEIISQQQQVYARSGVTQSDADYRSTAMTLQHQDVSDRVHQSANSPSPSSILPFAADSPIASSFLPVPAKMPAITTRNGKPTRPFKAYPKDFLALATTEGLLDDSNKRYMEFRRQFLNQLHPSSGLSSNKNMKRPVQSDSPNQLPSSSGDSKDQAYWERRKKNNEAAKKSRDARRAKEDEIAIRAAFLERENVRLKLELASLRNETDRLRCMLYTS